MSDRAKRSRPEMGIPRAAETLRADTHDTDDSPRLLDDFDDRHAAWAAGVEYGRRLANRQAAQAIAQELLSAQAAEMLGLARREALNNHGPAWAELVCGGD